MNCRGTRQVVTDIWRSLGFHPDERPPPLNKAWQKKPSSLPHIFRCFLFLARDVSDKALFSAKEIQLLPVADRHLQHITLDTMGVFSILKQAQMAAPMPPQQQQQARRHRRRRRAGTKGRKRGWWRANSQWREQVRCGHGRYRPAAQPEELPEVPAAVWRLWEEAMEGPGAAAYKGGGEAQLL
jgi:hypothetical protein